LAVCLVQDLGKERVGEKVTGKDKEVGVAEDDDEAMRFRFSIP